MGQDYNYSYTQPSSSEASSMDITSLLQVEASIYADEAESSQNIADPLHYNPNPEADDGIPMTCYCGNDPCLATSYTNEDPYMRYFTCSNADDGDCHVWKCTAAFRLLAYGFAADALDEYLRLGETTALSCLDHFTEGIIMLFQEEYLRRPTKEDLQRLLDVGESRGFPGIVGSIDCMHWEWKNCPTTWKGQYTRGSGKPTIVLEAVASHALWIWHVFFGPLGTLNDINFLDRSPVFDDVLQGRAPTLRYVVNKHTYNLTYYLTDGIYPKWSTFIQFISLPQGPKAELFAKVQESTRKDVERAFGILQSRFAIVRNPALQWYNDKIAKIMRTCIILHNMIVENKRDRYTRYDISEYEGGDSTKSPQVDMSYNTDMSTNLGNLIGVRNNIHDKRIHEQLKNDLIENIWNKFGGEQA